MDSGFPTKGQNLVFRLPGYSCHVPVTWGVIQHHQYLELERIGVDRGCGLSLNDFNITWILCWLIRECYFICWGVLFDICIDSVDSLICLFHLFGLLIYLYINFMSLKYGSCTRESCRLPHGVMEKPWWFLRCFLRGIGVGILSNKHFFKNIFWGVGDFFFSEGVHVVFSFLGFV